MTTQNTLLLDTRAWDLVLDAADNIAMARPPYAVAQDVASALRLFLAECWYNIDKGIPYFSEILGHAPPVVVFQEYMVRAALTVPGVISAECSISGIELRTVTGQVTFHTDDGQTGTVSLT